MTSLSFLQVGDIHYPSWKRERAGLDDKDASLSRRIKQGLAPVLSRSVLHDLHRKSEMETIEAVAFMGDFTSYGYREELRQCLNHFSWLCKSERSLHARPALLLVPGNHDVAKEDAFKLGQTGKFQNLLDWAQQGHWYPPPVEEPIHIKVGSAQSGFAHFFLVNTTLGSWEKYLLPAAMRTSITETFDGDAQADLAKVDLELAGADRLMPVVSDYDQLDTPYVGAHCLQALRRKIEEVPRRDAVVIVGHHNVLPQETPRLSAYAELLNAGYFRRFLLSLRRPITYLHGHTHTDLIEEVSSPRDPNGRIICVSAPLLEQGFNELSLHFDDRKRCIGVRILPWRFLEGQTFGPAASLQAACPLRDSLTPLPSHESRELLKKVPSGARYNLDDIRQAASTVPQASLPTLLIELFFWRLIEIDFLGRPEDEWRIYIPNRIDA